MEEEWYVAYLDILGITDKLKDGKNYDKLVEALDDTYTEIFNSDQNFKNIDSLAWETKYKIFSDNIVFAVKRVCDNNSALMSNFFVLILLFQYKLFIKHGLLLRGAICRGAITFKDNNDGIGFVIGPTLIQAYEMERDYAICPRIILDDIVADEAITNFDPITKKALIAKDIDERYYVDYIKNLAVDVAFCREGSQFIIDRALQKSETHINNLRVAEKYNWIKAKLDIQLKDVKM